MKPEIEIEIPVPVGRIVDNLKIATSRQRNVKNLTPPTWAAEELTVKQ